MQLQPVIKVKARRSLSRKSYTDPSDLDGGDWYIYAEPEAWIAAPDLKAPTLDRLETVKIAAFKHTHRYTVLLRTQIGSGSHGKVYKAVYGPDSSVVAVKIIRHNIEKTERISREVKVMMTLSHVNIVRAFHYIIWHKRQTSNESDYECTADLNAQTWIVQEYCESGCLSDLVYHNYFKDADGMLNAREFLNVVVQLCDAIRYMHTHNIVHGDLKCSNVLITRIIEPSTQKVHCVPKIADFGVSRIVEDVATVHTQTIGTISHMPPEMMADGHMSKPADMYAFGMIMYEMIASNPPFHGESNSCVIESVLDNKRPTIPVDTPAWVIRIIQSCWRRNPEKRPSAEDAYHILRSVKLE